MTAQSCPRCGSPCVQGYWLHCTQCDGDVSSRTCEGCGEEFPILWLQGHRAPWHDHHCDPARVARLESQRQGRSQLPVDAGKTFADKLRDAELLESMDD